VAAAEASMRGTETAGAKPAARRLGRVLVGRRRRAAVLLLALAYAAAMLMLAMGGSEGFGSSGVVAGALGRRAQPAPPRVRVPQPPRVRTAPPANARLRLAAEPGERP